MRNDRNKTIHKEPRKFQARYFKIGGMTVGVRSDLPFKRSTFHPKFKSFEVRGPGKDNVSISHHFFVPDRLGVDAALECYRRSPYVIYQKSRSWIYLVLSREAKQEKPLRVVTFNRDHSCIHTYNRYAQGFLQGGLKTLSMFPTDQIFLARLLADRDGFFMHACGIDFCGKGLLFAGHSGAGKSTIATLLKGKAKILCDDRIIVRKAGTFPQRQKTSFRIYGTWSHGTVSEISPITAPLKAILFLRKKKKNRVIPILDRREKIKHLLTYLVRPFVNADWWRKSLAVIDEIVDRVPCYTLEFNKTDDLAPLLKDL